MIFRLSNSNGVDDIGNRTGSKVGGDADGLNLSVASYSVNNLNQYISRSMTGAVEVVGLGYATNAVLVNGQTAYRKGEYFWKELLTNNASGPLWVQVQTTATNQTTQSGYAFVPKNPQTFTNDIDGNLVRDGQWTYAWDAENRLVTVGASGTVGPQISLRFEYDAKGRRIRKQVWSNKTFTGNPTNDAVFLYDGWNVVAELNATNQNVVRSYLWGLDLSGSMQGAGGVGGLLKVGYVGAQTTNAFVALDGNGNVSALVNAADGKTVAVYEYGPFGEVIRATGPMAKANPVRFSTKYQDGETDLLCYGYRYYRASTGRWISRDPYGELGFHSVTTWQGSQQYQDRALDSGSDAEQVSVAQYFGNPYQLCWGNGVSRWDYLGLVPQGSTFFGVYLNYNDYKTEDDAWRKIGGTVGSSYIGKHINSCAARVSAGLNQIDGEKITGSVDFINSVPPQGIAGRFISNARRMNGYLTRKWGTKSECSKTEAYYFKSKTKKGDLVGLLAEIVGVVAKCKCGDDFEFVAVVSSLTPEEPQVSGHVGVVTRTYHDIHTPYGDASDVWLLPPTLK